MRYLKITLVIIIGLLLGLVIHGLIEITTIWILTTWLNALFLSISWKTWLIIHFVFTIILEILGIVLAFWLYKKYWKQ